MLTWDCHAWQTPWWGRGGLQDRYRRPEGGSRLDGSPSQKATCMRLQQKFMLKHVCFWQCFTPSHVYDSCHVFQASVLSYYLFQASVLSNKKMCEKNIKKIMTATSFKRVYSVIRSWSSPELCWGFSIFTATLWWQLERVLNVASEFSSNIAFSLTLLCFMI